MHSVNVVGEVRLLSKGLVALLAYKVSDFEVNAHDMPLHLVDPGKPRPAFRTL